MRPDGFPRHGRRGRGAEEEAANAERTLNNVQRHLARLSYQVPMAEIEDLPPDMQRHVVGMPRDWVRVFRRMATAIVSYLDAHPEPRH